MASSDRKQALSIHMAGVGDGQVVRNTPAENLAAPNPGGILLAPATRSTANLRLFEGMATPRPGYANSLPAAPDVTFVNGLYWAQFSQQDNWLVRGSAQNAAGTIDGQLWRLDEAGSTWINISPAGSAFPNLVTQPWTFAMVPSADPTTPVYMIAGNEASDIVRWDGGSAVGTWLSATAPKAPKVLVSFLSRAFAINFVDDGTRRSRRVGWSIVGDAANWTGLGSGVADIDDDPWPGVAGTVMGGRLVVFKGGANGGAIYVLTPTGSSVAPVRVDAVNPGTNVGAVVPRSVVPINSNVTFFLGHDAAYLYDGVRALLPFAEGVARDITSRLNYDAVDTGFALYRRELRLIELHVPVDGATTPNEAWAFDIQSRRAYGPWTYPLSFLSATPWLQQNRLSWNTWGQSAGRTWDNLTNAAGVQYLTWDGVVGSLGSEEGLVYGATTGAVVNSRITDATDAGAAISVQYDAPPITPTGWTLTANGQAVRDLRPDDRLVLREVVLRHNGSTSWTPTVEGSIDGSSWVTISDGSAISAAGGRMLAKTYYVPHTLAPSSWFQVRIRSTSAAYNLHSVILNFTYAGSGRHE